MQETDRVSPGGEAAGGLSREFALRAVTVMVVLRGDMHGNCTHTAVMDPLPRLRAAVRGRYELPCRYTCLVGMLP
jgi:hypothetical protein